MSGSSENSLPKVFNFLLVPNFTLLAYSSAVEPLRMANTLSGRELYNWNIISLDSDPTPSSSGVSLPGNFTIYDRIPPGALLICAGIDVLHANTPALQAWLKKAAKQYSPIGALCTGTFILAEAQLLAGYRCTIHWEYNATLRETHPNLVVSQELFEVDRDRYTCAGGVASLDMMLHLIRQQQGAELSAAISEQLICDRIRDKNDRQRIPLRHRLGTGQPKLLEAVSLMEANIEEPMALDELSRHIGLSRRQLERLFKSYLSCVPTRYYLQLRLERARQLLLQTSMPVVDIALACGFISAPHFSKCYRLIFGIPPREDRRRATSPN
ncbi:MAG: HTH-type transcriptional regulator CdhR [Gammaproteobacteria bacterium]|nr:HTH-type transcriptional regulator CdhR [Gammaproteobacteria bacterium]